MLNKQKEAQGGGKLNYNIKSNKKPIPPIFKV